MGLIYSSQKPLTFSKMVYGYYPDAGDERDLHKHYDIHHSITSSSVKLVDLRDKCPEVFDQGKLGSCTANAICANYAYIFMKENDLTPDQAKIFSRLFVYWNERNLEGTVDKDSGASLRDGIKTLHTVGVPLETVWPYDIAKFNIKPSDEAFKQAAKHIAFKYHRLSKNLSQMKQCLMNGDPFVFGFVVYESFESEHVARTGLMPMPQEGEKMLGGHAVMAVGFDETKKCFIIRNSWGSGWGDNGYFYMPYDFMVGGPKHNSQIKEYASDFWVIESTQDQIELIADPNKIQPNGLL